MIARHSFVIARIDHDGGILALKLIDGADAGSAKARGDVEDMGVVGSDDQDVA